MILASAAILTLFRSVRVGDGTYRDGLLSQNPPVRELVDTRPDELWVIQVNPRRWDGEPTTMVEIADRRNELAGNLSLHQELGFIEKVDQLLEEGRLAADGKYKQIVVRLIELSRPRLSRSLTASKLNRDPAFIRDRITWTVRAYRDDPTRRVAPRRTSARAGSPPCGWAADQAEGPSASKWNTS
jgi:NTE family protein